jgi:hypothetical protein
LCAFIVVVVVFVFVVVVVVTNTTTVVVVVIIIVVVGKYTVSFMQGIYTYIPERNHVPRIYSVAAILSLLFMVPMSLVPELALMYSYISTF